MFDFCKESANTVSSYTGKIILGIYNKNSKAALNNEIAINTKLMSILCKPETLILAYRNIKGNKGGFTAAAVISKEEYNNFDVEQKDFYIKSSTFPDKISLKDFIVVSSLLKSGRYTWGFS